MEPKETSLTDWTRILIGDTPWTFLLEVMTRAGITYVLIMFSMRLLGRRVASQYTLFELSVVVTMAGAIGVPLQAEQRGMLPPLIIMALVIVLQRTTALLTMRSRRVDNAVTGKVHMILSDGVLNLHTLRNTVLPREKVFSLLRMRNVQHLGQLSRVYIEPSGSLSVVWSDTPQPGLSIIPEHDELREACACKDRHACTSCGNTVETRQAPDRDCDHCGARRWTRAAIELED